MDKLEIPMTKEDYFESNIKEWLKFCKGSIPEKKVRREIMKSNKIIWDKLIQPMIDEGKAYIVLQTK